MSWYRNTYTYTWQIKTGRNKIAQNQNPSEWLEQFSLHLGYAHVTLTRTRGSFALVYYINGERRQRVQRRVWEESRGARRGRRTRMRVCERKREELRAGQGMSEFTDSRNRPDFPPLWDCLGCTPFQRLTRPLAPLSPSAWCLSLSYPLYPYVYSPLFLLRRSRCARPFLVATKLDDARKFAISACAFPFTFTVTSFAFSIPQFRPHGSEVHGPRKARHPKFGTRAQSSDIVSRCASSHSSFSGCNLWKASQSAPGA